MAIKKRLVVAGMGSIGQRHARLLALRDDISLELMEPNAETLEKAIALTGRVPTHTNFEEMLQTKPDIVWLATPTNLHASQSLAALAAGAHVFCEKPMTSTLNEALAIQQAVKKSGRLFNVGFYLHFASGIQQLRHFIQSGRLGNLVHIYCRVGTYITLVNSLSRYQSKIQGSLFGDYSHQTDILCWLTNECPTSVTVLAVQAGSLPHSSLPNSADILLHYNQSMHAHIHLNYLQYPQRHTYEIVGDQAWVILDFDNHSIQWGDSVSNKVSTESYSEDRDQIFRAEHTAFFEALEGKRGPESSVSDGVINAAISEAIIRAWQSGKTELINQSAFQR